MASKYRNLGQASPAATTLTDLYTATVQTVVSSIVVCNTTGAAITFRISHAVAGAADATKQYLYRDVSVPANDTFVATLGITMAPSDVLRCYASAIDMAFNVYGGEVS